MSELNVAVQGLFQLPAANESLGRFSFLCLVDMTPVFTTGHIPGYGFIVHSNP